MPWIGEKKPSCILCLFDRTPQATLKINTLGNKPSDCIVLNRKKYIFIKLPFYVKRRAHAIIF